MFAKLLCPIEQNGVLAGAGPLTLFKMPEWLRVTERSMTEEKIQIEQTSTASAKLIPMCAIGVR
ncbi:MAG: hypothetical protein WCE73_09940, partial [Candidatus Angelobacter sp.]